MAGISSSQISVIAQLKFGQYFEDRAEFQRLALVEIELFDLRLRDGIELLFSDGFFDALRNQRLQNFSLDVVGKAAANQCHGSFAGAEAGHARHLAIPW